MMPWDDPPPISAADEIAAMKRDFAYAVETTCIAVHSNNEAFRMLVNTKRGQLVPRNEVKFSDGTTVELQDTGMCRPNVPYMTVQEILAKIVSIADELGLTP